MSDNKKALEILNKAFELEMAGIVRYLHYSFMIMGPHRIPIQKWFRAQADEAITHATTVGEKITSLGGHPPAISSQVEESHDHTIDQMLQESLNFEQKAVSLYRELISVAGDDIALEEMARELVREETEHIDEVRKMLRRPEKR